MARAISTPVPPHSRSQVEAEAQRQKTALLFRSSGVAQSVNVVNAGLLAYTAAVELASPGLAAAWWGAVVAISAGRYLLARRFRAAAPDAASAPVWRRRYITGTALMALAWATATVLFMWNASDGARLFAGLVLSGMVAGAVPLLAPVPAAFRIFAILVGAPMAAVMLLQARSALHWSFGAMSLIFLASVLAAARYLHETMDRAIRLGLEQRQLVEDLEQAQRAAAEGLAQREAQAATQRLLKAAVEQSNSSIVMTDANARITFVNSAFTRTTGYSAEEAMGQNPRLLKSGRMPMEVYQELWAAIASGHPWHGELCNRTKGGQLYWEAANISPIVDEQGRTTNYLAVMDDISERKRIEDALQQQRSFLAAVLENEPECVTVTGPDGVLQQINGAGLAMLEVADVEEANRQGLGSFVLPEYRAAYLDLARRVQGGEAGVLEFRLQGRRGTRRWLEMHATPLRDAAGRVTHQLAVTRDVTQRRQAEERLALALRGSDLATADWHVPTDVLVFGEGWTKLLGHRLEELRPHVTTLAGLMHPEDVPAASQALIRHLKGETAFFELEVRLRHKAGHWVWVSGRGMAVERSPDGRALRLAGTAMDVTERKRAEAEIARLSEWNELLLNSAGDGIYGADAGGSCTFINPAALGMLGLTAAEVSGKNVHALFHHHHRDGTPYPEEDCPLRLTQRDGVRREVEDSFIRKDGEPFPVHLSVTPMREDGQVIGVAVVFQDISRRKALEEELTRQATTDPLTGVANRRRVLDELGMELERLKRFGRRSAFLMVDVDHFKRINDTLGHPAGDAVLRHLAGLAQARLRRIDLFGRLGGEEFGILLPGADLDGALTCAESFRLHVADTPLRSGGRTISFTISVGVAVIDAGDGTPEGILARADRALYRAKELGRNRVEADREPAREPAPP